MVGTYPIGRFTISFLVRFEGFIEGHVLEAAARIEVDSKFCELRRDDQ